MPSEPRFASVVIHSITYDSCNPHAMSAETTDDRRCQQFAEVEPLGKVCNSFGRSSMRTKDRHVTSSKECDDVLILCRTWLGKPVMNSGQRRNDSGCQVYRECPARNRRTRRYSCLHSSSVSTQATAIRVSRPQYTVERRQRQSRHSVRRAALSPGSLEWTGPS